MFVRIALALVVTGIVLGAMAAHKLQESLTAKQLASFGVGVDYQLYNALGVLVLALLFNRFTPRLRISLWLITVGTVLFSVSIYALAAGPESIKSVLGPVTPIGGSIMIVGWALVLFCIPARKSGISE
jgi:uncharacterized membrane protein YgdD (TMEM256/DUF423 family)